MNTVEKLLKFDAGKLKTPEKEIKMRLKKLDNQEFTFRIKAIDPEFVAEMQENSIEIRNGDIDKIKTYNQKVFTIIEGCPDIFKNKDIMRHFNCPTPKELVKKLLLSGEMDKLKSEIDKLNGYDQDKKEEIKNS